MSFDMTTAPDLVTLIRQHAADRPQAEAVGFLADPDDIRGGVVTWTYEQLDHAARSYATWLQERLAPESRVLLLHPSGLDFTAAYLGCLYAGMIAVPAPLPGRHRHHQLRLATISADAGVSAILTTSIHLDAVRAWADASGLADLLMSAEDGPGSRDPRDWRPARLSRSTTALLQYTSGSTGDPKGVVVTHDNVLYNLNHCQQQLGWAAEWRAGGWVPLYHDMALQVLLNLTFLRGSFLLLMEPLAFVRNPLRWLRLIDEHDIQVTWAPNFAYQLCLSRITDEEVAGLDLSRWRIAGNASEPVHAGTLAAFAEKFAPAGFRPEKFSPTYGMAEANAFISGLNGRTPVVRTVDHEALAEGRLEDPVGTAPVREIVSCGVPNDACEVRVVDPETLVTLPDRQLGEIWIRGRSVAGGYWGREDDVFGARTAEGEEGFLRTGDIGVLEDGELYVQGRLKDTLIVRGRNLYPQDIEQELRSQHPELGRVGAVFAGHPTDDAQGVVVTHEVTITASDRLSALAAELRHTVGREFGVQVSTVLLLRPGAVLRTTSGKVRRSAMRELFHEGRLAALYSHSLQPR